MGKRGPKPKNAAVILDKGLSPALVRRTVDEAVRGARDPNLATPIGVMHLNGYIDAEHLAAAVWMHTLRCVLDAAQSLPPRSTPAIDYNRARGMALIDTADPAEARRRRQNLERAWSSLEEDIGVGTRALEMLKHVVIEEKAPIGWEARLILNSALGALVEHRKKAQMRLVVGGKKAA